MKILTLLILTLMLAACGDSDPAGGSKVRFYQSPMHPWIKADAPGQCTICGMALVPVYEGEDGFDSSGEVLLLPESSIQVLQVQSSEARKGTLEREIRLAGVIDDDAGRHRIISAHFDGRIERPFIEQVGEEVRKGEPLAEIYSPDLLYVVREYQRARATGDRSVFDTAARRLIQFGLTEPQLDGIAAQSPDQYGINILSPMTGTVIKRHVNQGQYVKTGDPLFELGDFSHMWFHATVYEADFPLVHLGQEAEVTTPAAPGGVFPGVVTLIDPNFDPITRSTTVRIEVANPMVRTTRGERRALPHRAYGEAVLRVEMGEGLLVPRSAILDTGREAIAYVDAGGGRYERRQVVLAGRGDEEVMITSGVSEGEKVVTRGNLLMDAESQMKDSGGSSALDGPATAASEPEQPLPPSPYDPFLLAVAATGAALAADDLEAYEQSLAALEETQAEWPASGPPEVKEALARLAEVGTLPKAAGDLKQARAAYWPLSEAAADLTRALQTSGEGAGVVAVFACPMTESAFPGAPSKARWIQTGGSALNPWFGAEMLECGVRLPREVRP